MLTKKEDIHALLDTIDPIGYATTRNFLDGKATRLSPYITHNILPLEEVVEYLQQKFPWNECEKLISELAWKQFFYNNWEEKGDAIFEDLKHPQPFVKYKTGIPEGLENANTGITALDEAIKDLKITGYMHNHARMWLAAYVCHVGKYDWKDSAKWMYYYLFDGDAAVNFQSWQWVAGSSRAKWYIANQENINHYSKTLQKNTAIDCEYSEFENIQDWEIPKEMSSPTPLSCAMYLPKSNTIHIDETLPTVIYHLWNLDSRFQKDIQANRILVLEPDQMRKLPMNQQKIEWLIACAQENITGIQIFVGNIENFCKQYSPKNTISQAYVSTNHWSNTIDTIVPRPKIFPEITGFHSSFFGYWKKITKKTDHIKKWHV